MESPPHKINGKLPYTARIKHLQGLQGAVYGEYRENHIGRYVYECHMAMESVQRGMDHTQKGIRRGFLVGKVQTGRVKIWLERWGGKK